MPLPLPFLDLKLPLSLPFLIVHCLLTAFRYNTCAAAQNGDGLVMEYDGHHTFDQDLGFHVPGYKSGDHVV